MKNKNAIILLFLANTISGIAQGICMISIPWYFSKTLHQESLFGLLYFVLTCVTLLWGSYSGTLVDKYNRKNIFLIISLSGFFSLLIAAIASAQYDILPWYMAIFPFIATALIYNIHFPNLYSLAQEITENQNYSKVTSALEVQGQFSFAISGALASFLITGSDDGSFDLLGLKLNLGIICKPWHLSEIFIMNAITYLIAFALIWQIKFIPTAARKIDTGTLRERFVAGWRFLSERKHLLYYGVFSLFVFATILIASTNLMPRYVYNVLHENGSVYANSEMYFAIGAMSAGLFTFKIFGRRYNLGVVILSLIGAAIFIYFAAFKNILIFYIMHLLLGFANAAIRVLRVTYLFENTPNAVIGRTSSVFFISNVFWRLIWIGIISMPFFAIGDHIKYACWGLALFCLLGAVGVWYSRSIEKINPIE